MTIVQQSAEKISQEMVKQFISIQNHEVSFTDLVENIQRCVNQPLDLLTKSLDSYLEINEIRTQRLIWI